MVLTDNLDSRAASASVASRRRAGAAHTGAQRLFALIATVMVCSFGGSATAATIGQTNWTATVGTQMFDYNSTVAVDAAGNS